MINGGVISGGPALEAWPTRPGEKLIPHKGGGGGGGSSVTVQDIPAELKPLANQYTNKAIGLSNQGYQPYTGQRYADTNAQQYAAANMVQNRALGGNPIMNQANATLMNMLRGGNTNPYLDQMVSKAQDSVRSQYNTAAINSGSFGNSGLAEQYQRNLSDVATNMYGNAYNTDRANQMQALGMAQSYGNQAYTDAEQLMKAGRTLQDQQQRHHDYSYQNYLDRQAHPYKQLAAMAGVFGSNLGGTSRTTQSSGGGGK